MNGFETGQHAALESPFAHTGEQTPRPESEYDFPSEWEYEGRGDAAEIQPWREDEEGEVAPSTEEQREGFGEAGVQLEEELPDELEAIWRRTRNKGRVFDRLRLAGLSGPIRASRVIPELLRRRVVAAGSEDQWLAERIVRFGAEPHWPASELDMRASRRWPPEAGNIEGWLADAHPEPGGRQPPIRVRAYFFPGRDPGRRALVIGGVHGNEPQGAWAVELLRQELARVARLGQRPLFSTILVPVLIERTNQTGIPPQHRDRYRGMSNAALRYLPGPVEPNRTFPLPGWGYERALAAGPLVARPFDRRGVTRRRSRPVPPTGPLTTTSMPLETRVLLSLLERFRPQRIASVHGKRVRRVPGDAPGIFVDPRGVNPGTLERTNRDHRNEDIGLARAMLEHARDLAHRIPADVRTASFAGNQPSREREDVEYRTSEHPQGNSLGMYAPVDATDATGRVVREAATTVTIEIPHWPNPGELDEIVKVHVGALQDVFLERPLAPGRRAHRELADEAEQPEMGAPSEAFDLAGDHEETWETAGAEGPGPSWEEGIAPGGPTGWGADYEVPELEGSLEQSTVPETDTYESASPEGAGLESTWESLVPGEGEGREEVMAPELEEPQEAAIVSGQERLDESRAEDHQHEQPRFAATPSEYFVPAETLTPTELPPSQETLGLEEPPVEHQGSTELQPSAWEVGPAQGETDQEVEDLMSIYEPPPVLADPIGEARLAALLRDAASPSLDVSAQEALPLERQATPGAVATRLTVSVRTDFTVRRGGHVAFDWRPGEPVISARAAVIGTPIAAVTNNRGMAVLDTSGLPDGDHILRLSHTQADRSTAQPAGPAVADPLPTRPSRIYRVLDVRIRTAGGQLTAAWIAPGETHGGIGNRVQAASSRGHLPIDWKPVWMRSPMKQSEQARVGSDIDLIVVHRTGGSRIGPPINTFLNGHNDKNAHYVVDRDGHVIKTAEDLRRANQAGTSRWRGRTGLNASSIGIEMVNETGPFPSAQYASLTRLVEELRGAYPTIPAHRILGHSDIATTKGQPSLLSGRRAEDPGLEFDWQLLERRGLGMVPLATSLGSYYAGIFSGAIGASPITLRRGDRDPSPGHVAIIGGVSRPDFSGTPIRELHEDLEHIGYSVRPSGGASGAYGLHCERAVDRFQRHFFAGSRKQFRAGRLGRVDALTANWIKTVRAGIPP
jgi:N-acetyl-anhydromuramyl-L-alanine amidase AmpD